MTSRRTFLRTSLLGLAAAPASAPAQYGLPPPPVIQSKSCYLIDAVTGAALFERDPDRRRAVASTQKLLSALIAVETTDMNKITVVQESETKIEPHKLRIVTGERLPLRTLLHAMLIESCNDAAHCMARSCAGSAANFAVWMNRRATQLGMKNSHFVNAHGLPAEGQFSTARDMSMVARVVLANPTLRNIVGRHEMIITRGDGRQKKLETTNYLLRPNSTYYLPICTGMKTGYTNLAGKCLISSATHRGRTVICVLLGAHGKHPSITTWKESKALLQWALGVNAQ